MKMHDFGVIVVTQAPVNKTNVYNPTNYPLIGQGAQGAVFKISGDRCVKIYAANEDAEMEYTAFQRARSSSIIPRIYEKGPNYIIMEYLRGPSLSSYLQEKGMIPKWVTKQILHLLREMRRFHFTRIDCALRHIYIDRNNNLKVIDLVHAYTIKESFPSIMFTELRNSGLLRTFLQQVKEFEPKVYLEWKKSLSFNII
jgi:RIO-like serine/threonine protein kinase